MADVFISYKTERRPAVEHLARVIENNGYSVWFDYAMLSGGGFTRQIEREIRAARASLVLWCPMSVNSDWVLEEATLAKKLGKLIPVFAAPVDPPLGFQLADAIDLTGWNGSPRSGALDRLFDQITLKVHRKPKPNLDALRDQEANWRRYGAPKFVDFQLYDKASEVDDRRSSEGEAGSRQTRLYQRREAIIALGGAGVAVSIVPIVYYWRSDHDPWAARRIVLTPTLIGQPMARRGPVISAQFSPDGRSVVTGSKDKTARLWDATTGAPIGQAMMHEDPVISAQFSPDGRSLVTTFGYYSVGFNSEVFSGIRTSIGSASRTARSSARLWDAATGAPIGQAMLHENTVISAQFSPDSRSVVTGSSDNTARLWDAATGAQIGPSMMHEDPVNSAQFSADGRSVVTASSDKTARLWDAATGFPIGQPMKHGSFVGSAQFSPDGRRVVTASSDNTARLWDAATGAPIGQAMMHENSVISAQFSPDGRRVVTGSYDKTARLWDAATGLPIGQALQHFGVVKCAHFSPDGRIVVTGSYDKTARLWDATTGAPIGQAIRHGDEVNSAQFSPDARSLVTASSDKTARLWDVSAVLESYFRNAG